MFQRHLDSLFYFFVPKSAAVYTESVVNYNISKIHILVHFCIMQNFSRLKKKFSYLYVFNGIILETLHAFMKFVNAYAQLFSVSLHTKSRDQIYQNCLVPRSLNLCYQKLLIPDYMSFLEI